MFFILNGDAFYAGLQNICPTENSAKYKYKFYFCNENNTQGVSVTHMIVSSADRLIDVLITRKCGNIYYDAIKDFIDEECNLECMSEILTFGECLMNAF
jgi:hypothetical protein